MLNTLIANLLIAGHGQRCNSLACRLLNRTQQASLFRRNKQNRLALTTRATGSTNTVNIGLIVVRNIKIDNMADALNIQTASRHICSHYHIHLAFLKAVNGALTQCLTEVAIQRRSRETSSFQALGNIHRRGLGAHKNNHAIKAFNFQHTGQGIHLLMTFYRHILLFNALNGFGFTFNANALSITQILLGNTANLIRHGGRKQCTLTFRWRLRQNSLNIINKTHTQHFIGFIQNKAFDLTQIQTATTQVI